MEGNRHPPVPRLHWWISACEYKVPVACKYGIHHWWLAHAPAVNDLELRPVHGEAARLVVPVDDGESDLELLSFL